MPVADMNLPALPASPALPALAAAATGNDATRPEFILDLLLQTATPVEDDVEPSDTTLSKPEPPPPLWGRAGERGRVAQPSVLFTATRCAPCGAPPLSPPLPREGGEEQSALKILPLDAYPVASSPENSFLLALFTSQMPPPALATEPDSQPLAFHSSATPAPATYISASEAAVISPALPANAEEPETAAEAAPIPSPEFSAVAELPLKVETLPESPAPPPQTLIERLAPVTAALASTPPNAALMPQAADFHDRFAERVLWSVRQDEQEARLELHPRDLGRVDIQIKISGSETQIVFAASDSSAREAIHHALPRLAELMSASGLQLTQAQVTSQSFSTSQTPQHTQARASARRNDSATDEPTENAAPRPLHRVGLVDHYA